MSSIASSNEGDSIRDVDSIPKVDGVTRFATATRVNDPCKFDAVAAFRICGTEPYLSSAVIDVYDADWLARLIGIIKRMKSEIDDGNMEKMMSVFLFYKKDRLQATAETASSNLFNSDVVKYSDWEAERLL